MGAQGVRWPRNFSGVPMIHYIYAVIIAALLFGGWYGKGLIDDSWEAKITDANAKIEKAEAKAATQATQGEKITEVRYVRLEPTVEAIRKAAEKLVLPPAAIDVYCSIGVLDPTDCARLQSRPTAGPAAPGH